jgi:hypothetical protein
MPQTKMGTDKYLRAVLAMVSLTMVIAKEGRIDK